MTQEQQAAKMLGASGGYARSRNISPLRRQEIARMGGLARAKKAKEKEKKELTANQTHEKVEPKESANDNQTFQSAG